MPQAARVVSPANVRTVYVNVMPAPASLSERRAVLRALKQHGDIEVFQKLNVRPPSSPRSSPLAPRVAMAIC